MADCVDPKGDEVMEPPVGTVTFLFTDTFVADALQLLPDETPSPESPA